MTFTHTEPRGHLTPRRKHIPLQGSRPRVCVCVFARTHIHTRWHCRSWPVSMATGGIQGNTGHKIHRRCDADSRTATCKQQSERVNAHTHTHTQPGVSPCCGLMFLVCGASVTALMGLVWTPAEREPNTEAPALLRYRAERSKPEKKTLQHQNPCNVRACC